MASWKPRWYFDDTLLDSVESMYNHCLLIDWDPLDQEEDCFMNRLHNEPATIMESKNDFVDPKDTVATCKHLLSNSKEPC